MFFEVPGTPRGKQRPRVVRQNGRTISFTPDQTVQYENLVRWCYKTTENSKRFPDDMPLKVIINAYYEIPKSASKKKRAQMLDGELRPTKKPDADNIAKIICDALNGIAYRDDAQVVTCIIQKWYSEEPSVSVEIEEIEFIRND
jgi:Holliday junction resolvase RusA-like endonuclease